jgi:hypothetical protein
MRLFSYAMEQKEISQGHLDACRKRKFNIMRPHPIEWARYGSIEQRTYGLILVGVAVQASDRPYLRVSSFENDMQFANII